MSSRTAVLGMYRETLRRARSLGGDRGVAALETARTEVQGAAETGRWTDSVDRADSAQTGESLSLFSLTAQPHSSQRCPRTQVFVSG